MMVGFVVVFVFLLLVVVVCLLVVVFLGSGEGTQGISKKESLYTHTR